jgi:8-amino-7-oxononanoate synthase
VTAFAAWLDEQAVRRAESGLTRHLVEADRFPPLLDLAGNDYLGLAKDPRVIAAGVAALRRHGAGATASRLVCGTLAIHTDLERAFAAFCGFPAALVFSTGYHANLSVVSALADPDTLIVSDAHVHASLVDACRLARSRVSVTPHGDLFAVGSALSERVESRALVLVETIYSVLGDAPPIDALADVCRRHGAVLIADEAHAIGVAGPGGRGLIHQAGLGERVDVIATATLSKSLAAQGGVVLCSPAVRDHLINRARPFIYDTALAPAAVGAAGAALSVVESHPDLVIRVRHAAAVLAAACRVESPAGAVLSVPMPNAAATLEAAAALQRRGVRVGCFRPPSTPDGSAKLRITAHADHTDDELELAAKALREVVP